MCARSAVRKEDRLLMGVLLRRETYYLNLESEESAIFSSFVSLELSMICSLEGKENLRKMNHARGILHCPSKELFMTRFNEAQNQLQINVSPDCFSRDIIGQAFDSAEATRNLREPACCEEPTDKSYNLRDLLSVDVYLRCYQDGTLVSSGVRHLRNCIKYAISILQRRSWRSSHNVWLGSIGVHWPGSSKNIERAIFFDLLWNWSACPYPCDDLEIYHENSLCLMGESR